MKMLYTSSLESTTDRFKITKGRTKARVRIYYQVRHDLNESVIWLSKNTRTVKPDFYAVPPQNIFEISPGFQPTM